MDAPLDGLLAEREAVSGLARRLSGRDVHAAEDLEQEVWAAALARPPREASSLRGWLRTVTRTRSVERLRRLGRAGGAEREAARPEAIEAADEAVARRDQALRLAQALRELEEPYLSVLLLRFVEDLAPREVARRLGRPVETVRTQTRRGLLILRRKLEARSERRPAWLLAWLVPRRPRAGAPALIAAAAGLAALALLALGLTRTRGGAPAALPAARVGATTPSAAPAPVAGAARARAAALDTAAPAAPVHARRWVDVTLADGSDAPLAGAEVSLVGHGGTRPAGRTDALGRLRVTLDLSDLASADEQWFLARDAVELAFTAPGRAALHAFVFLPDIGGASISAALDRPGRALAGRVSDAQGRPLAGAEVHAGPARGLGARERLGPGEDVLAVVRGRTATTDFGGRFVLDGLPDEPLRLAARAAGHALGSCDVSAGAPGDIALVLEPAEALCGSLRLHDRPAAGARVEWSAVGDPHWPAAWRRTRADAEGRFELARPAAGKLTLAAQLDDARATGELELGDGPPNWATVLARSPAFAVRLLEADGRAAAGSYLSLRGPDGSVLGAAECDGLGRASFAMDAAGPFVLVVLPPRGSGTWPREVLRDLTGAGTAELVLRLAPEVAPAAALHARLPAGRGARIALRHLAGEVEHSAAPDEHGELLWTGLPAARWSARVLLEGGSERELGEFELAPGETRDLGAIE